MKNMGTVLMNKDTVLVIVVVRIAAYVRPPINKQDLLAGTARQTFGQDAPCVTCANDQVIKYVHLAIAFLVKSVAIALLFCGSLSREPILVCIITAAREPIVVRVYHPATSRLLFLASASLICFSNCATIDSQEFSRASFNPR